MWHEDSRHSCHSPVLCTLREYSSRIQLPNKTPLLLVVSVDLNTSFSSKSTTLESGFRSSWWTNSWDSDMIHFVFAIVGMT